MSNHNSIIYRDCIRIILRMFTAIPKEKIVVFAVFQDQGNRVLYSIRLRRKARGR